MNLRDLKYLVAVADFRHFGRAAEACFVSQPTLSMQLKKLEETLGVVLIERGKQVMLTEAGHEIAAKAREILAQTDQLIAYAKESNDPLAGELRLGAFPTLAPYLFPLVVPKINAAFPKLKLLLVEEKTNVLLSQLKEGKLDAAFIAAPVEESGIAAKSLFSEAFLLAVPRGHALAQKQTVTAEDIAAQTILLLDEGHCLRDQALALCQRVGAKETDNFRATSLETLRQMVASGVAVTLMPQLAIGKEHPEIVYIPFENQPFKRKIMLCTRSHFPRKFLIEKLVSLIRAESALYF
jgi:LysR family hydrogen peroxide-inducible transcriptional activator